MGWPRLRDGRKLVQRMALRTKTLLVIGLTLVGLLSLIYLTAHLILDAGFTRLEAQDVRSDVQRVVDALASDLTALSATAADYASWDDTYAFAIDANPDYVANNLPVQTYANLRLNLFVIVASDGSMVYGGSYDPSANTVDPLPAGLTPHLAATSPLLNQADPEASITGLLLLPEGPVYLASQPILPSSGQGAIRGSLLLGRYLDAAEVARLSELTHLDIEVGPASQPDLQDALATLSPAVPVGVRPLNDRDVAAYTVLPDLYQQPALVLSVVQPRALYREGQVTIRFFLLALLLAGVVFGAATWFLLERFVLSRLAHLSQSVRQIGDRADPSLRVTLPGADELSGMAAAINGMLASLAQAHQDLRDSEQKFRTLAETSAAAIFIAQGPRMRYANSRAEALTGFSGQELLNLPFHAVVPDAPSAPRPEAASAPVLRQEIQLTRPGGGTRWLEVTSGHIDYDGQPATIATAYDITDRKQTQEELLRANSQLKALVDQLEQNNHESTLLSRMTDLLQACPTAEESYSVIEQFFPALFFGQTSALYLFRASRDYLSRVAVAGPYSDDTLAATFAPETCWALRLGRPHGALHSGSGPQCTHLTVYPPGGYWCVPITAQNTALGILHLQFSAQPAAGLAAERHLAETVGERLALALANVNLREALRHQAIRDPLTGLFNRRYMQETLDRELSRAQRNQHSLGLLFVDLDHFKHFNDRHGHEAGDTVLRAFGELLRTRLRVEDIVCRYGGEEFVLIMPEAKLEATLERAEALRASVQALNVLHLDQVIGGVTVSIGLAMFPEHGATGDLLLRAADQALYQAKEKGRDRVEVAEG